MKKVFKFLTVALAAAMALSACKKETPVIIVPQGDEEAYDYILTQDIEYCYQLGYTGTTLDYATFTTAEGDHIWECFGLNSMADFIAALGTADISNGTTQTDATIFEGAIDGSTGYLNETASTTNGWGHWFSAEGDVVTWGETSAVFTEGYFVSAGSLEFTFGSKTDVLTEDYVGKTVTVMDAFYDDEVTVALCINAKITADLPAIEFTKVGSGTVTVEVPFDAEYTSYELNADVDAICGALGVSSLAEVTGYGVNPDGSIAALYSGGDIWYNKDGTPASWGSTDENDNNLSAIHFGIDTEANCLTMCMFPDETLAGNTYKATIALSAGTNAYYVTEEVTIKGIDYTQISVLVSYEAGESLYELNENNIAAICSALGVEDLNIDECTLVGINADDSVYSEGFTANNGYWYSSTGNVTSWGSEDFNTYIEYRGENTFGCGLWGEAGDTNTVKFGLQLGDKTCILTFNLTVAEPDLYNTTEIGSANLTASQTLADGYGGQVVDITAVLNTLGTNDFTILDNEGGASYTSNGGFWYTANGEITSWGEDAMFFFEPSYDESDNFLGLGTGVYPEHATAGSSYSAVFRIADIAEMKHVTVNLTLTVTE